MTNVHSTPRTPAAAIAVPTIAPARECVVDTGSPVRDAISTQANAPAATDRGKSEDCEKLPATSPVLKVATRADVKASAANAPATVQAVPHDSPRR